MDYMLVRSKRKTVALYVRDGGVEVRAPVKMPKSEIDRFVLSKELWIKDKLEKLAEQNARRENFALNYGGIVTYRGREYPIVAIDGNSVGFDGKRFYMPPELPPEQIKAACVQIYRALAKRHLTERTLEYAGRMSVNPAAIKINSAKTRWGSCSSKKSINFSWKLVVGDDSVIDYVIVHELAHLAEMNHSARFWAIIESLLPDYRQSRESLKELQRRLSDENWDK